MNHSDTSNAKKTVKIMKTDGRDGLLALVSTRSKSPFFSTNLYSVLEQKAVLILTQVLSLYFISNDE